MAIQKLPPRRSRLNVPVRFTEQMIDQIKPIADREQMTVSAWIRHEIQDAIQRRHGAITIHVPGGQTAPNAATIAAAIARARWVA